jgi:hypothetical protein
LRRKRIKTWKAVEAEVILLDDSAAVAGEPFPASEDVFRLTLVTQRQVLNIEVNLNSDGRRARLSTRMATGPWAAPTW